MKIGILSDTHGHEQRTRAACETLRKANIRALVHAGDIGTEGIIYAMAEYFDFSTTPLYAVWGNMERYGYPAPDLPNWDGITIEEITATFDAGGFKAAVIHGDLAQEFRTLVASREFDLVFTGHTHVASDRRQGKTRIINPGAVYRSPAPSVAVFDTKTQALETLLL